MDISDNSLPDQTFFLIQEKLCKYIRSKGFVTWKHIQKACRDLLEAYPHDYSSKYGNFPEYKIFMPLLRNGLCEIARNDENGKSKSGFICFPDNTFAENSFNPLLLLNNIPSLQNLIENFKIEDSIDLQVQCDLYDKYIYKDIHSTKINTVGIYKTEDKAYYPTFLFDGKKRRTIPSYEENMDALNVARCYVRCSKGNAIFTFHANQKELSTRFYSELPILVARALILFDKSQLKNKLFWHPSSSQTISYKNIDLQVVKELQRIFGKTSVEETND